MNYISTIFSVALFSSYSFIATATLREFKISMTRAQLLSVARLIKLHENSEASLLQFNKKSLKVFIDKNMDGDSKAKHLDYWGHAYNVKYTLYKDYLVSNGPDGILNSPDDILIPIAHHPLFNLRQRITK